MKILMLIFLFAAIGYCEGPLFRQKDPVTQQEFENAYQDLRSKSAAVQFRTKAQLLIEVPTNFNLIYLCTDCTTDALVISTGTTIGSFARGTSRTTAVQ